MTLIALLAAVPAVSAQVTAPANDDFDSATVIAALPAVVRQDVAGATSAADDPLPSGRDCGVTDPRHSVWFRHTASGDAILDASTIGSDYETVLAVYRGSRGALTQVACNFYEASGHTHNSRARFHATGGTTYHIMVAAAHEWALDAGSGLVFSLDESTVPLLEVGVSVDPAGALDPASGAVTVRGTATCSRAAWFVPDGNLRQGRVQSFLQADEVFTCEAGETVPWSATTVSGRRAAHRPGQADVLVVLYASDGELDRAHPELATRVTIDRPHSPRG